MVSELTTRYQCFLSCPLHHIKCANYVYDVQYIQRIILMLFKKLGAGCLQGQRHNQVFKRELLTDR